MSPTAVLIGPPAAGKSRIGKSVARDLGLPFIDTDARIVAKHGAIPDIFATVGEKQFRQWERDEVVAALTEDGIVSVGGGAIENADTQVDLARHTVVLITVSADAVADRIDNEKRPLLSGIESWKDLVERRMPIYERLADVTVDTSVGPMDVHASRLTEILRSLA